MECRIKYSNIRYPRHDLLACTDTKNIGRVMQRCQRTALLDLTDHILIDQYGRRKLLAAMHHTMTNGFDLIQRFQDSMLRSYQSIKNGLHRYGMIRNVYGFLQFLALHLDRKDTIKSDSLTLTGSTDLLCLRIDQLVF